MPSVRVISPKMAVKRALFPEPTRPTTATKSPRPADRVRCRRNVSPSPHEKLALSSSKSFPVIERYVRRF